MAAVRVFYMRVMNDDTLRPFFEDIDLARLKNKLVSILHSGILLATKLLPFSRLLTLFLSDIC